jgi:hypothetical protein
MAIEKAGGQQMRSTQESYVQDQARLLSCTPLRMRLAMEIKP